MAKSAKTKKSSQKSSAKTRKKNTSSTAKRSRKKNEAPATDAAFGTIHAAWTFDEYTQHQRGQQWYIVALSIAAAFLLYAILTRNYLFAIIILISVIVVYLQHKRTPLPVRFQIMDEGISFDEKYYYWRELNTFWIAYDPPEVKRLYITHQASWKPELSIPLENQNPIMVRRILKTFLKENLEQEFETPADAISRRLRI